MICYVCLSLSSLSLFLRLFFLCLFVCLCLFVFRTLSSFSFTVCSFVCLTFPFFISYNSIWVFFCSVCLYFHFYFCISFCAFWFLCFCLSVFIYLFVCNFRQYFLKDRCVLHSACWCACCLRKINFYFKFFLFREDACFIAGADKLYAL
jgi:hypothetical protein